MALSPEQKPRVMSSTDTDFAQTTTTRTPPRPVSTSNESSSMWMYIVGAIVLIGLAYYFFSAPNKTTMNTPAVTQEAPAVPVVPATPPAAETVTPPAVQSAPPAAETTTPPAAETTTPPAADTTTPVAPATPPATTTP